MSELLDGSDFAEDTVQSDPSEAMSSIPGTVRRGNKLLVSMGTKPFHSLVDTDQASI